ncbi:conserved hypothetical protein [delta proteobacterium NaphS2]|nr:conserved hypothetical protein [delta proteobacterium NaphS2]
MRKILGLFLIVISFVSGIKEKLKRKKQTPLFTSRKSH